MLSEHDKAWMRANRDDVTTGRKVETQLVREVVTGEDPYTGEKTIEESIDVTLAVWQYASESGQGDLRLFDGYLIETGDMIVKFGFDVPLTNVNKVILNGVYYMLVSKRPLAIGNMITRYKCLARRIV